MTSLKTFYNFIIKISCKHLKDLWHIMKKNLKELLKEPIVILNIGKNAVKIPLGQLYDNVRRPCMCWSVYSCLTFQPSLIFESEVEKINTHLCSGATLLSIMTFSITTLSKITFNANAECHWAECRLCWMSQLIQNAECQN